MFVPCLKLLLVENCGFKLRTLINSSIKDNGNFDIYLASDVKTSIAEAVEIEGYSCEAYGQMMSKRKEWGNVIEICTVAEMFSINVGVFILEHNCQLYKLPKLHFMKYQRNICTQFKY